MFVLTSLNSTKGAAAYAASQNAERSEDGDTRESSIGIPRQDRALPAGVLLLYISYLLCLMACCPLPLAKDQGIRTRIDRMPFRRCFCVAVSIRFRIQAAKKVSLGV